MLNSPLQTHYFFHFPHHLVVLALQVLLCFQQTAVLRLQMLDTGHELVVGVPSEGHCLLGQVGRHADCKISLQLTMSTRQMRGTHGKRQDESLASLLKINSQYAQLLRQLAQNNSRASSLSLHAYLFDTLQTIKQLNACMKGQLKLYEQFCSSNLQAFLERRQLADSSNLIGKYEGLNDQVEVFQEELKQLEGSKAEEKAFEALVAEEEELEMELKRLGVRRVGLRNKNQMIEHQIECGQSDLNFLKARNYEQEIKLRKMQGPLKDKNRE